MLHPAKVATAIFWNARRQLRLFLRLPKRECPISELVREQSFQRHRELVRLFTEHVPAHWDFRGKRVCEVGSGDCLALASLILGRGAAHVDLVEPSPVAVAEDQVDILRRIQQAGYALDHSILYTSPTVQLDASRITLHPCFMDRLQAQDAYDYLFSISVMEHVEGLEGFYATCHKALKPKGEMFHLIDFSGHGELEDPIPPLDFQTYPDWLYNLMCPRFHRATRNFLSEQQRAVESAGFLIRNSKITHTAEQAYLSQIWPELRKKAKAFPREEVAVLEAVLTCEKL